MILLLASILSLLDGQRTVNMMKELNSGILQSYSVETGTFAHAGVTYRVLKGSTEDFTSSPLIFFGMRPAMRECIALDPNSSPLLDARYRELLQIIDPQKPVDVNLESISTFVKEVVFQPERCDEKKVIQFLNQWMCARERVESDFTLSKENVYLPVMSIDQFLAVGAGVCRHLALVTAYFVDRLSKEGILPHGRVHLVRQDVALNEGSFAHAWVLYQHDQEAWLIDSVWEIVKNRNQPDDALFLEETYGTAAMAEVKHRYE